MHLRDAGDEDVAVRDLQARAAEREHANQADQGIHAALRHEGEEGVLEVLAAVRLDALDRVEAGDVEALRRGEHAEDADHREPSVVDLGDERLGLLLGRHLLREAERVPQVERRRVREEGVALERRVVAGLAARAHVVRRAARRRLAPQLEEEDGEEEA